MLNNIVCSLYSYNQINNVTWKTNSICKKIVNNLVLQQNPKILKLPSVLCFMTGSCGISNFLDLFVWYLQFLIYGIITNFVFLVSLYTLLIIPDAWREMVNGSLFLFKTKQKASLYFTNWRHISAIINKVYMPFLLNSKKKLYKDIM